MAFSHSPKIPTDTLIVCYDAMNPKSYPGTGTTWKDLASGYDLTLNSSATWNSSGYMNFESGIAKYLPGGTLTNIPYTGGEGTICIVSTIKAADSDWKTLVRGSVGDHHIIVSSTDGISLGMYDNDGGNFQDSGFDVDTLTNHTSEFHFMAWKLSSSSPYYEFFYDDNLSSSQATLTTAQSEFNQGFASIGGYHNFSSSPTSFSQEWGKISIFLYYDRKLNTSELEQVYRALKARRSL